MLRCSDESTSGPLNHSWLAEKTGQWQVLGIEVPGQTYKIYQLLFPLLSENCDGIYWLWCLRDQDSSGWVSVCKVSIHPTVVIAVLSLWMLYSGAFGDMVFMQLIVGLCILVSSACQDYRKYPLLPPTVPAASRMLAWLLVSVPFSQQGCLSKQLLLRCLLLCSIVLGCLSVCSPSLLLDLPIGISLSCFCFALSSSFVFSCWPLSLMWSARWPDFLWLRFWHKVTLRHCLVDSLLGAFCFVVTWEAPLSPNPHLGRGKGHSFFCPDLYWTFHTLKCSLLCHVATVCVWLSSSRKSTSGKTQIWFLCFSRSVVNFHS